MKIAVVCANPWETFLPFQCQGNARFFYRWLCKQSRRFCINSREEEQVAMYGVTPVSNKNAAFETKNRNLQIVYIQSHRREILEKILDEADKVIVGMHRIR